MNYSDPKKVRAIVKNVTSKRKTTETTATEATQQVKPKASTTKKKTTSSKMSKKELEKVKRRKWALTKFFIFYVFCCFVFLITNWCFNTMQGYYELYEIVYKQNQTIEQLTQWLLSNDNVRIIEEPQTEDTLVGYYKLENVTLTYYCECKKCCGPNAQGITASGKRVEANKTIAVDPKVIPLGKKVIINGQEYEAQDTGSAIKGNKIDIYVPDHQLALELGVKYADVYVEI